MVRLMDRITYLENVLLSLVTMLNGAKYHSESIKYGKKLYDDVLKTEHHLSKTKINVKLQREASSMVHALFESNKAIDEYMKLSKECVDRTIEYFVMADRELAKEVSHSLLKGFDKIKNKFEKEATEELLIRLEQLIH